MKYPLVAMRKLTDLRTQTIKLWFSLLVHSYPLSGLEGAIDRPEPSRAGIQQNHKRPIPKNLANLASVHVVNPDRAANRYAVRGYLSNPLIVNGEHSLQRRVREAEAGHPLK